MRRAPKALLCGTSPLLGHLVPVGCVEGPLPPDATGDGDTGNIHETSGTGDGGAGHVGSGGTEGDAGDAVGSAGTGGSDGGGCHETDPFAYLDALFAACEGCRVDFIAAHWYACDRPALEGYLGELKRYGRPIWLTELSCGDSADRSLEAQAAYMREAVPLLESDPDVFRYAWFSGRTDAIPDVDLLGASGELTPLGELHVSLPHAEGCSP
ncbi:glycosyl hydrolase [Sorangium sp. So ce1000]|uniref:glycosyl hydrolase n=1 Tax=Sorangium sp. So ce1000 TaxID=3133325 RepID=UPI003F5F3E84